MPPLALNQSVRSPTIPAVWFPAYRAGSGADVFTERLATGLRRRGYRAEITWLPQRAEYAPWTVPAPEPPAWATVAHVNTWLPPRFLPRALPVVVTAHHCVHGPDLRAFETLGQRLYHRIWIKPIEHTILEGARNIVAVSSYTAERTKSTFHLPQITVIHNGIDLGGVFQPNPTRQPHYPFRLLYVGNWSPRKGVDLLAPIMETLGPAFELRCTIGPKVRSLPSGWPDNMYAIERPADSSMLAQLYNDSDALLFPSRLEGFGLVALEAQACGLPVIATCGSALTEVIEDGVTGILCPHDDVQAFATAAQRISDNTDRWLRMTRAARTRVEHLFDFETMIDRYIEIYRSAMTSECTE